MKKYLHLSIISLFISFSACEYFESDNPSGISRFDINITNLKPLPDSLVYVGWIDSKDSDSDGRPDTSYRLFESNTDQSGVISFSLNEDFIIYHQAQQIRLVVEEKVDSGSASSPGNDLILSGRFTLGSARLSTGVGDPISSAEGVYTITTATDTLDNNLSGIWFVNSAADPEEGLTLPVLNDDWVYEGLIIIGDDTISTGTFTDPGAADDSSPFGGSAPGLPFPGEDFLQNPPAGFTFPLDLSNAKVLVTLEYTGPDYIPPYFYVLFEGTVPAEVQANSTHEMQNTDAPVPSGVVSITVDIVE